MEHVSKSELPKYRCHTATNTAQRARTSLNQLDLPSASCVSIGGGIVASSQTKPAKVWSVAILKARVHLALSVPPEPAYLISEKPGIFTHRLRDSVLMLWAETRTPHARAWLCTQAEAAAIRCREGARGSFRITGERMMDGGGPVYPTLSRARRDQDAHAPQPRTVA